jgi:hypothetical protein
VDVDVHPGVAGLASNRSDILVHLLRGDLHLEKVKTLLKDMIDISNVQQYFDVRHICGE